MVQQLAQAKVKCHDLWRGRDSTFVLMISEVAAEGPSLGFVLVVCCTIVLNLRLDLPQCPTVCSRICPIMPASASPKQGATAVAKTTAAGSSPPAPAALQQSQAARIRARQSAIPTTTPQTKPKIPQRVTTSQHQYRDKQHE